MIYTTYDPFVDLVGGKLDWLNDISNIFLASFILPLTLLRETKIESATGNPEVDIT